MHFFVFSGRTHSRNDIQCGNRNYDVYLLLLIVIINDRKPLRASQRDLRLALNRSSKGKYNEAVHLRSFHFGPLKFVLGSDHRYLGRLGHQTAEVNVCRHAHASNLPEERVYLYPISIDSVCFPQHLWTFKESNEDEHPRYRSLHLKN